ncbi:MAG: IS1 family transposase, partial [Methylovirgula sp.]
HKRSYKGAMNKLPFSKRVQILHMMVEGNSVRGIARLVDVSPVTVLRQLELAGKACEEFHDATVRNVKARRIETDEIWSFVFAKDRNASQEMKLAGTAGSVWTWTALDVDSKLIVSYYIGGREAHSACAFMRDVAGRLANRVQLTTDGHRPYLDAVDQAFGIDIDYGMLVKFYSETPDGTGSPERKYSPGVCTGTKKTHIMGSPDHTAISTSHVEKHNQSMRQHMKRFARLTAAHSKKLENHAAMVALYAVWYNFARINSAVRVAPAMAAGLSERLWGMADIVRLVEAYEDKIKL